MTRFALDSKRVGRRRRYAPKVPRTALGALAVMVAALTMGALVLLPVALDSVVKTIF